MQTTKLINRPNLMAETSKLLPFLALAFGITALGFSAIFVRWASVPGSIMSFYRLSIATILLTPFFLYKNQKQRTKVLNRKALIFPVIGGVMTAFDHTIWASAMDYTSAANATLLNYSASVWVALIAWFFFKEKMPRLFWGALIFTFIGVSIVLGSDFINHPTMGKGDLLALFSSFFYTGYFIVTQSGRKHFNTLNYIWLVGVTSMIVLLVINLIFQTPLTGYPPQAYWSFLGAAILSQIGGYVSIGYALGHIPASIVSPTMITQPVLTAVLAVPLLGESLRTPQIIGGLIVIIGIYLIHHSRREKIYP